MENKLLSSVKAGAVGACVFGLSQAAMAANVQISGQIDTYIESYTAGDKNTVRMVFGRWCRRQPRDFFRNGTD